MKSKKFQPEFLFNRYLYSTNITISTDTNKINLNNAPLSILILLEMYVTGSPFQNK